MIKDATSEQNGFANKESGFNVFFLRSNNKNVISCVLTVFNKKCGLVVFLARTKGVSPAYHLQFMGGFSMAEPQSDFESL